MSEGKGFASKEELIAALEAGQTVRFADEDGQIYKTKSGYFLSYDGGHVDSYHGETFATIEELIEEIDDYWQDCTRE